MASRLPIIAVADGYIICGGVHPTAALKLDPDKPPPAVRETHQMLRPIFHDGEYQRAPGAAVNVGDVIEESDDGGKVHLPRPVGQ